jgi:hypothetical protein
MQEIEIMDQSYRKSIEHVNSEHKKIIDELHSAEARARQDRETLAGFQRKSSKARIDDESSNLQEHLKAYKV